jgi:hypothetical protein
LIPNSLDEVEQLLFGQMRKIIVENPKASLSELKTLIEGKEHCLISLIRHL